VRRTVYPLVDNAHAIALTVDQGAIDTGTRSQPLCEIELELKRGSAADLFDLARELTQALPARLAVKSKSERGYEILDGQQELPVKAASIDLHTGMSAREAFKTIGLACLKQAINNEPALIRGDPEGVHQMRVGLRRLRAAMSLFAALLHDPQTAAIKNELKWLAGELGPARELEVLLSRVVAPMKRRHRRWRGMPSLSHELAERRDAALARAQAAVQSVRFRALTLDVAAWLEAGLCEARRTTSFATAAICQSRRSRSSS
jgi:inorganic triphosphatase YgiF